MNTSTLAFDFGGTKIEVCRMRKDGSILFRDKVATARLEPGSSSFLGRAFDLMAEYVTDGDDKIGLSWNAPVHEGKLTQSSLLGGPISVDLGGMLIERFKRSVQVESDVHAMALGEYRFGAGRSGLPFLLINMGSGAGIAYHDGRLMRGFSGGAGLVCNELFEVTEIGEKVIVDRLLSGRGVAHVYHRLTGASLTAAEVTERIEMDPAAAKTFEIISTHLGRYLVTMCRIFNPKTIVFAGSVAQASHHFLPEAVRYANAILEPACRPASILASILEAPACRGLV
ncbi:ROK family protein [Microvirga sp. G4-2]|uniref:ROK family protein n=1 Tax=Microvirga sp. G4-2 TaxID=3434467 RepID=UPI004044F113